MASRSPPAARKKALKTGSHAGYKYEAEIELVRLDRGLGSRSGNGRNSLFRAGSSTRLVFQHWRIKLNRVNKTNGNGPSVSECTWSGFNCRGDHVTPIALTTLTSTGSPCSSNSAPPPATDSIHGRSGQPVRGPPRRTMPELRRKPRAPPAARDHPRTTRHVH